MGQHVCRMDRTQELSQAVSRWPVGRLILPPRSPSTVITNVFKSNVCLITVYVLVVMDSQTLYARASNTQGRLH